MCALALNLALNNNNPAIKRGEINGECAGATLSLSPSDLHSLFVPVFVPLLSPTANFSPCDWHTRRMRNEASVVAYAACGPGIFTKNPQERAGL